MKGRSNRERPQPGPRKSRRAGPSAWGLLLALVVFVNVELIMRLAYPAGSHLLGQRLGEGHGFVSLAALLLVLIARPLKLLAYRRALGLAAFAFAVAHTAYTVEHVLAGNWESLLFLSPAEQAAVWFGVIALLGLVPLAVTSTNLAMRKLGRRWKQLHKLGPIMTVLAVIHTVMIGVHFGLWPLAWTSAALLSLTVIVYTYRKVKR